MALRPGSAQPLARAGVPGVGAGEPSGIVGQVEQAAAGDSFEGRVDTSSSGGPGEPVSMFEDGGLPWRHVSPRLATARLTVLSIACLVPAVALVGLGVAMRWDLVLVAVLVAVLVVVWLVGLWVVRRQVSAITYLEMAEELVIRKGRLARTLVSVPYGRLQFVDVQSGPLARRFGMAELELHTASPQTGGTIPGLPIEEAEALRQRLAALGESQRAGL